MKTNIVLASQSPRRKELLAQLGLSFAVEPADIDETVSSGEMPREYVLRMAVEKAEAITANHDPSVIVIGSDTSVVCDDRIYGKPADEDHLLEMLGSLSARSHEVMSAVAAIGPQGVLKALSVSRVTFCELSESTIRDYWRTGEPADKAGGYAIQGLAARYVSDLQGSYSGVMGLPLFETAQLLQQQGVELSA